MAGHRLSNLLSPVFLLKGTMRIFIIQNLATFSA